MTMNMDKIEEYLESLEELIYSSLDAASPGTIRDTINQFWNDITRYGPGIPHIPEVRLPGLGDFQVPPPPPPPPPSSLYERSWDWVEKHPYKAGGIVAGVVGSGLLVGYGGVYMRAVRARKTLKASSSTERRQVIVVLGGDTPLGHPLVIDLEKKGYIVITSVASQDAADVLERKCHGYVRALVLDPSLPEGIPAFLRNLSLTLSRRFPITSAGDPFASPASHPYIHSVVSLLTLPIAPPYAPLEHVSLQETYLPYLTRTQITPLQVIQSLLPLLRHVPASGKKSIIVCLPATETRFGLPFASVQSMGAAATLRAVEVLRREIAVAAMTGKSDTMKNIRVVAVEVGAFSVGSSQQRQYFSPLEAMENWTASEKITYGPAFAANAHSGHTGSHVSRRPTDVKVFTNGISAIISDGQSSSSIASLLHILFLPRWLLNERISVGAGAGTYRVASHLPSLLLDTILNIPHFLIAVRNALLPTQPFIRPNPATFPAPATLPPLGPGRRLDETSDAEHSEPGSEADVESNSSGEVSSGVDSSWVSLKDGIEA